MSRVLSIIATTALQLSGVVYLGNLTGPVQRTDRPFYSELSWSPDGSRILFSAFREKNADIYIIKSDGTGLTKLTDGPGVNMWGSFSPDGRHIVFQSNRDGNEEIYVMNADGSTPIRLTINEGRDICPSWSNDGTHIAFSSSRDGGLQIYIMKADGAAPRRLTKLSEKPIKYYNPVWSPDDKRIVFYSEKGDHKDQVQVIGADGSNQTTLTGNVGNNVFPAWSPDGRQIIFTASRNETDRGIYAVNADGTGLRRIGNPDAALARWSPDGRMIAFIAGQYPVSNIYTMMADGSGEANLTR